MPELNMDMLKMLMDERHTRVLGFSSAIAGYGTCAIRGAFILNGSAAVAVLARLKELTDDGKFIVLLCACGAACAVACAAFAFVTQRFKLYEFLDWHQLAITAFQRTGTSSAPAVSINTAKAKAAFCLVCLFYALSLALFGYSAFLAVNLL